MSLKRGEKYEIMTETDQSKIRKRKVQIFLRVNDVAGKLSDNFQVNISFSKAHF